MSDAQQTPPHATETPPGEPLAAGFEDFASARHSLDPEYIGHYRILQRIGEGGMGVVYVAEQREPVRRTVALKVIKLGMDSKEVVARFEAERQALALMSHPNVAKVFEAGMTDTGRPFFAMEHVPGVPLTQYCDENKAGMRARLELFIQVCHAVQHAHQKGIIHRDLKPSNVLVTMFDARPVPKVIDFGIAKAANHQLTQRTLFTQTGSLIGTPEYMSPEQAQTGGLDVDTRSDVYSLGVILYELMTGSTPFDAKTLRAAGPEQMVRILRESEPPRPSTRLTSSDAGSEGKGGSASPSSEIAKRRGTDAHSLRRAIAGDLDWIALKAMEKDRTRRYDTANGLAADVRRHLDNEPVLARPPSTVYRWSKFARKHKAGMAAAAMVALALLVGLGGTTYGFLRARVERDNAVQAKAAAVQAQTAEAREREAAEAVNKFLQEMLASADPNITRGKEISVRQMLDEASRKVEQGSLRDQPNIEATVRGTLGRTYWVLAQPQTAETHLRAALDIRKRLYGNEHPKVAESLDDLGRLLRDGRLDESEPLLREGLAMRRKLLPGDHIDVAMSLSSLAFLLTMRGDHAAAEPLYRECLAIRRKQLGPDHPHVASTMSLLTRCLEARDDLAGAEAMLREALAMKRKALGSDHLEVARTLSALGNVLRRTKEYDAAESHLREALAIRRKLLGNDDTSQVAWSLEELVALLMAKRDLAAAEPMYRELLAVRTKAPDHDLFHTGNTVHRFADLLRETGDVNGAETVVREHLTRARARVGENHLAFAWASDLLAWHLHRTGRSAEAEPLARQALAIARVSSKTGTPIASPQPSETRLQNPEAVRFMISMLTPILLELHQYGEAETLSRETLALADRDLQPPQQRWLSPDAKLQLGTALLGLNRPAEAEPLLREGYEAMDHVPFGVLSRNTDSLQRLVRMYEARGEPQKAAQWQARLDAITSSPATQPAGAR